MDQALRRLAPGREREGYQLSHNICSTWRLAGIWLRHCRYLRGVLRLDLSRRRGLSMATDCRSTPTSPVRGPLSCRRCTGTRSYCMIRSNYQTPGGVRRTRGLLLSELALSTDILSLPDTIYPGALPLWVHCLGSVAAVRLHCRNYLVVRRFPAIAVAIASPFTAWNFLAAHNGFLTASLLGPSLLALEHQPIFAGVFIGCLSCKPQLGILFPVALATATQWRAFASAAVTATALAGISIAAFGSGVWQALPGQLAAQTTEVFLAAGDPSSAAHWGYMQTIYGLVRLLNGSGAAAWMAQGAATIGVAIIVWLVWRSAVRYSLKAATLSAAALIATPHAFAYDMAAIAIPVAFLARDQLRWGIAER
jgi:hypothetical protein